MKKMSRMPRKATSPVNAIELRNEARKVLKSVLLGDSEFNREQRDTAIQVLMLPWIDAESK